MTIDEQLVSHGFSTNTLGDTLEHYNRELRARSRSDASASLDPIYIPGQITPVQTEGADVGVNYNMAHASVSGLAVVVQPYLNMAESDWVEVFWGNDDIPVASAQVAKDDVGKDFSLYVAASRIPTGVNPLYCQVTRTGGGNGGESLPVNVLVRFDFPGGTDPAPDEDGHQGLPLPEPELPASGVIDEEAAKAGVKVRISAYPNMREYDRVILSWGGEFVPAEVTQDDIDAGFVEILVTEATILAAGDSDKLILIYRVVDEVQNQSSDWSPRTYVPVEVGTGLLDAPLIVNPDDGAIPQEVIDLDKLGDDDLGIMVMLMGGGAVQVGDQVALKWVGSTALGQDIVVEPEAKTVPTVPFVLQFSIPNADVRPLVRGRAVASYTVSRAGAVVGTSKRAFATFLGVEQGLPKPTVSEAAGGALDPDLAKATVVVPGDALQAGDMVFLTWQGTRSNGTPLLFTTQRPVSGNGAGQPMAFEIDGAAWVKPLEGGQVSVHYRLGRSGAELPLESEREVLQVGEARAELPAPTTRPPAEGGVLDPDDISTQLEIVIAPYPDMADGQTVHVQWRASQGPNFSDSIPISQFSVGFEVVFTLTPERVRENLGAEVEISYWVEEPGQPARMSGVMRVTIGESAGGESSLLVMGARYNASINLSSCLPRRLSAFDATTLQPVAAEWRYDGDSNWATATEWVDTQPGLNLFVRHGGEALVRYPARIIGSGTSGFSHSYAAFVAIRDEREGVADLIAWGDETYGGKLDDVASGLTDVLAVSCTDSAFAALRRTGEVVCWGTGASVDLPPEENGDFVLVRGNSKAFVGQKRDGRLFSWGDSTGGVPVPVDIRQHRDYVELLGNYLTFAARRATGHVVAWGSERYGGKLRPGQEAFTDITQLIGNYNAYAAMRGHPGAGRVIAWGDDLDGGQVSPEVAALTNVKCLAASTGRAFAVILANNSIRTWGAEVVGGQVPTDIKNKTNVVEVSSTLYAFCARLSDGHVMAWGFEGAGGSLPEPISRVSNIVQVVGGFRAFAALCRDGTVVAWGDPEAGGDTSKVDSQLRDVRAIYSNACGFAALTADGRVVTWGEAEGGGNSIPQQPELTGKVTVGRRVSLQEAEVKAAALSAQVNG